MCRYCTCRIRIVEEDLTTHVWTSPKQAMNHIDFIHANPDGFDDDDYKMRYDKIDNLKAGQCTWMEVADKKVLIICEN